MSYSAAFEIKFGKDLTEIAEFRNSHGCAPVVWGAMCSRYLGSDSWLVSNDRLWKLYKRKDIPEHHRAVLVMTFDHAYLTRKNFKRAANDIREFLKDFPPKPGYVNHWPKIAELLDTLTCLNFGIHQTSVSENPFMKYGGQGGTKVVKKSECYEVYETLSGDDEAAESA